MADKAVQLLFEALTRAAIEPAGAPILGTRSAPGLFPSTAAGRRAALQAREAGHLQTLRTEKKGRTTREFHGLTEAGLAYLLAHVSAQPLLEVLTSALARLSQQVDVLRERVRRCEEYPAGESLNGDGSANASAVPHANRLRTPGHNRTAGWRAQVLNYLRQWHAQKVQEDCPLPELYREVCRHAPELTPGQFHDGLRELHAQERIYLHPWTGPLYELPEPELALLSGHAVAFYASLQESTVPVER